MKGLNAGLRDLALTAVYIVDFAWVYTVTSYDIYSGETEYIINCNNTVIEMGDGGHVCVAGGKPHEIICS